MRNKNHNSCPKCRRQQYYICGSPTCNKCVLPKGKKAQIWDETGEFISCPYCGFTAYAGYWEDRGIEQFLKSEGVSSFGQLQEKRDREVTHEKPC